LIVLQIVKKSLKNTRKAKNAIHLRLIKIVTTMGVTRLKRKDRRNSNAANQRVADIKLLTKLPTIKNVDIEAIKASFAAKKA
jgi:hypothetical protein